MEYLTRYWKTLAALVYLWICLFDFFAVPLILARFETNTPKELREVIGTLNDLKVDSEDTIEFIRENWRTVGPNWTPFTLRGGGLFHLSFGALLTGAALNRNKDDKT